MKKKTVLIIVVVFCICAFLGYKAAQKIFPSPKTAGITQISDTDSVLIAQNNYLIIHVDSLTAKDPQLISIWAAFVYQTDPPQMMFVPLYPATNPDVHERISTAFNLNSDKLVSSTFINQVNKAFDIQTSGYILTDDIATSLSIQWLTGVSTTIVSTPAVSDIEKGDLRSNEGVSYQQFCQLLTAGSSSIYVSAINWQSLLPDHFSTNLPFETMALLQDQVKNSLSPIQCEVYLAH